MTANSDVRVGEDKSTWSPYPIDWQTDEMVGLPNPFTDVKNLKEAEKLTGVKMKAPSKIKGYDEVTYQVIKKDKFVQVNYRKDDDNSITIRKAVYDKDISGDYTGYKNSKKVTVKGYKVKLQGNGKTYSLATWTKGKYSYSISLDKAVTQKEMKDLIMEATEKSGS